jgi:putative DNA-invertase from lambdoid prophage Rac
MARLAYVRVSTSDQSIEAQRHQLGQGSGFDKEFKDEGVSGSVLATDRPGFAELLAYARAGDSIHVTAVDRLGRDALDVQSTVRGLLKRGVAVEVQGLGLLAEGVGELILAVLAQIADMERKRIIERTADGRAAAKASLDATGKTHRGKASLGRPKEGNPAEVKTWRTQNSASIAATAAHFDLSTATVKRYCAA